MTQTPQQAIEAAQRMMDSPNLSDETKALARKAKVSAEAEMVLRDVIARKRRRAET